MLYQRTCCVILPRRIVVGRQFIGGLDFFVFVREGGDIFLFFLVRRQKFVAQRYLFCSNMPQTQSTFSFFLCFFFLFSASLPVGKIVGSFSAVQSEGNLIHSEFSSL